MNSRLRTKLHYFLTDNTSIQATSVLPLDEDGSFHLVHIDIEGEKTPHAWRESVKREMRKRVESFRNRWLNPKCWPAVESPETSDRTLVAEALSPHTGKGFRRFFDDLIAYPRFVNTIFGDLETGGIKFIGKLEPPPQKIPDKANARFLKSGDDFDPAVDAFKDFVKKRERSTTARTAPSRSSTASENSSTGSRRAARRHPPISPSSKPIAQPS